MSLCDELCRFSRTKLRHVDTIVVTEDGRKLLETIDNEGRISTRKISDGEWGFVGDVSQDLQVGEILPGVIIGSQDVAHTKELLKQHNVTHILNLGFLVENIFPEEFFYKDVKILDRPTEDITQYFEDCFSFMDEATGCGGCVLVHCNAGISRSAAIVIAYLMKRGHSMSFQEAFDHVKSRRPRIRPNDGFVQQLQDYENKLKITGDTT